MTNSKNIPTSASALLGKKLNKIHVLKFNEKKSKPGKPVVDCKCLECGKPFSNGTWRKQIEQTGVVLCDQEFLVLSNR